MTNAARDQKDFEPLSEAGQVRNDMVSWIADLAQWHKEGAANPDPRLSLLHLDEGHLRHASPSYVYEWHLRHASRLGELADFLEALPDDDPLIQSETGVAVRNWHDQRIAEWFDYMAEFLRDGRLRRL